MLYKLIWWSFIRVLYDITVLEYSASKVLSNQSHNKLQPLRLWIEIEMVLNNRHYKRCLVVLSMSSKTVMIWFDMKSACCSLWDGIFLLKRIYVTLKRYYKDSPKQIGHPFLYFDHSLKHSAWYSWLHLSFDVSLVSSMDSKHMQQSFSERKKNDKSFLWIL